MNTLKRREDLFVHRLILNIINLGMQIGSICSLHDVAASIDNPKPCVATFLAMRFRYFTIWIVMLHIFYSGTDLTLMFYHHNEKIRTGTRVLAITEKLKYLIEGLFRCMLWPSSLMTTLFYWIVYIYVRKLIFPDFVDQVSGWGPYQFLHTWISMFVILDVLFRPRICPLSVILNMRFIFSYLLLYMNVFYYTGNAEGTWLDPISSTAYESCLANFIILHVFFLTMFPVFYILLWKVNNLKLFITGYLP